VLTTNTNLGFNGMAVSSAGGINGDGINDIVLGAENANTSEERNGLNAGQAYIVFGN